MLFFCLFGRFCGGFVCDCRRSFGGLGSVIVLGIVVVGIVVVGVVKYWFGSVEV